MASKDAKLRILVVEDEAQIREALCQLLESEGFEVKAVSDGVAGLAAASEADLIVLDVGLPGLTGFEVLEHLRPNNPVPVLILSAHEDGSDRVEGLNRGADDYLTKPFLPAELIARVHALFRRTTTKISVSEKGLTIDRDTKRVYLDGEPVELSTREYALLTTLAGSPQKIFTRNELLDRIWGTDSTVNMRQVDVYISRVRAKLRTPAWPEPIRSVWGTGYRIGID